MLMTRNFDYCLSASEGDNQSVKSSSLVVFRCFPGGYSVKLYISRGRLAWWLLAFCTMWSIQSPSLHADSCSMSSSLRLIIIKPRYIPFSTFANKEPFTTRDVCKTLTSRPFEMKHLPRSSHYLEHDETKSFG